MCYQDLRGSLILLLILCLGSTLNVSAQETTDPPVEAKNAAKSTIWDTKLTGDWAGLRPDLAERGVTADLEYTATYQGLFSGDGEQEFQYGGRVDALLNFNTEKMGLWKGGGFHTHLEYLHDDPSPFRAGALWPVNTGQILPLGDREEIVASSLYFSQRLGQKTTLMAGKINVVDFLASDPFFGGWGTRRFMNLAFVAPPSGVLPPVMIGGVLSVNSDPVSFTAMVYDPSDQTNTYSLNDLFADGVNVSLSAAHKGTISGRTTNYSLGATYSSREATDLSDVLLPPGLTRGRRGGSYSLSFQFSHLLQETSPLSGKGWGLSLKGSLADGNPNPIKNSLIAGIGGQPRFFG